MSLFHPLFNDQVWRISLRRVSKPSMSGGISAGLILHIVGIGILNIMLVSLNERFRLEATWNSGQ